MILVDDAQVKSLPALRFTFNCVAIDLNCVVLGPAPAGVRRASVGRSRERRRALDLVYPNAFDPLFLRRFSPVLRRLFTVLLRFPAFWRQDGENGRKMA